MKRTIAGLQAVFILICVLTGCGTEPSVNFDVKTQTVYVKGIKNYSELSLPDEIEDARVVKVQDDGFQFSAYLVLLRQLGFDVRTELPGLIDRTKKGIGFVRQYLRENAGDAYPSGLAELPVDVRIDNLFEYSTDNGQITLKYNETGTHREFLYLLALMDSDALGWEHFGYAWYVGTCINPYTEVIDEWPVSPELPYYSQCIAAGIDPANVTAADYRTFYDACSRVCFEKGLTHWGSYCESLPVTEEPIFTRFKDKEQGDTILSAFMAASFLAWLDEAFGFEQLSRFCFGQKTFDEAFGISFDTAYNNWRAWIIDTYPAG